MANSYNAPNKYFDIVSANVDVDGLAVLKGSDPASDDTIYVAEGYTVTINRACSILEIYQGDNYAGNAVVKTGHLVISASVTLTIYHATAGRGMYGEGSTSTITLNQNSEIKGNTNFKVGNFNAPTIKITSAGGKFTNLHAIYAGTNHNIQNSIFTNCETGIKFYGTSVTMPESLNGTEFTGCGISINDSVSGASNTDWLAFFSTNEIKLTGASTGSSYLVIRFGTTSGISRYMNCRFNAASIKAAPTWNTTTGIQTLAVNDNRTLTASWNAASHATGDTAGYRIYIRAGAAPDSFGVSSPYFLCETADTSFVIAAGADGIALADGAAYYVVVRAATALSNEDANTTSLSATTAKSAIDRIDKTTQVLLAIALADF